MLEWLGLAQLAISAWQESSLMIEALIVTTNKHTHEDFKAICFTEIALELLSELLTQNFGTFQIR
jgi:hypothetical protein